MQDKNKKSDVQNAVQVVKVKKPDEKGIVQIDCHIKIYNPNTGEEFLNKRDT